jgi:Predicted unsaturated glucuronyl hydrolase involved in regulation of bacterial surface properties, and related proteins
LAGKFPSPLKTSSTLALALGAARKHHEVHGSLGHYTGIVTLHGMARLAVGTGEAAILGETRRRLEPFVRGEMTFPCNYPNYHCGGNASAYLLWRGLLPEVRDAARRHADQILHEAPRDPDGIVCMPGDPAAHKVWIDSAFAVSPFLLFTGLAFGDERCVEEAFQQTAKMVRLFRDPANGLLHQSKNFRGRLPGNISEDHWSRGNGWGIYALAELACHLPAGHPRKGEAVGLFVEHARACLAVQNAEGLWHQEMTEPNSYVETSGSGLILYAFGAGLQAGLLDAAFRPALEKGLSGMLRYISSDLDIYHTCRGCLCPGSGTRLEYMATPPVVNDPHAFGPVVLSMGQAHLLGIIEVRSSQPSP